MTKFKEPERIAFAEFKARCDAQGVGREDIALICPVCGTVQSMRVHPMCEVASSGQALQLLRDLGHGA